MRWADMGFMPTWFINQEGLRSEAYGVKADRWAEAMDMYSTMESVQSDWAALYGRAK